MVDAGRQVVQIKLEGVCLYKSKLSEHNVCALLYLRYWICYVIKFFSFMNSKKRLTKALKP